MSLRESAMRHASDEPGRPVRIVVVDDHPIVLARGTTQQAFTRPDGALLLSAFYLNRPPRRLLKNYLRCHCCDRNRLKMLIYST